jgi:hypothetical protein
MIRGGFLSAEDRRHLIALARDGSAASRLTRRANALVLLDGRALHPLESPPKPVFLGHQVVRHVNGSVLGRTFLHFAPP